MRRREFVQIIAAGVVLSPLGLRAQQGNRPRSIGVLFAMAPSDPEAQIRVKAFEAALQDLGWTEGKNVRLEYHWAPHDGDLLRKHAKELVGSSPDVILATSTPVVTALAGKSLTDRLRASDGPHWERLCTQPGAPGGKPHRLHQFRVHGGQQVA